MNINPNSICLISHRIVNSSKNSNLLLTKKDLTKILTPTARAQKGSHEDGDIGAHIATHIHHTVPNRTQTDLLAAPDRRLSSLPAPNSSSVHIGTGTDTHWCPSGRLRPQQWWRPGGSGRWPAGEVPARESCCRWCWRPEPPPRTGPCQSKRNMHAHMHSHAQTHTHTDSVRGWSDWLI